MKANEYTQDGENSILPDMFGLVSQNNGSKKPSASPDEAGKSEVGTQTNVGEMKRKAIARRDDAIKNAKLALNKAIADVRTLQENAERERNENYKKNYNHYAKGESIVAILKRRASEKFAEAKKRALNEYNQARFEATERNNPAFKALEEEFVKERALLKGKKQKLENEHQRDLEKARKENETALEIARKRIKQAEEKYTKAMNNRRITQEDKQKAEKEYDVETFKYHDAVELAETKWQDILNDLGIGDQFRDAEEKLLEKLEQAKKKAKLDSEVSLEDLNKILENLEIKLREADKLAKEELSKAENEYNEFLKEVAKQVNITDQINENKWRRMKIHTGELLNQADVEFSKTEKAAINEYDRTLQEIKEMERNLAKNTKTEKKNPWEKKPTRFKAGKKKF